MLLITMTIMKCFGLEDEHIYIILPYFNFCKYDNRRKLMLEFIERMKCVRGIRIVVAEGRKEGDDFDLPDVIDGAYRFYRWTYKNTMWLKENLINLATRKLPRSWKYMAWIDADITFVNDAWVRDTINALQIYDIVYPWQTCVNLGPDGETGGDTPAKSGQEAKVERSFGYMHRTSKYPYHQRAKYGFWHPGYAVACTKKAYMQMGGLVDFAILGSGDRHMALALIGRVEWSAPGTIHGGYLTRLLEFQGRCEGLRLGYVKGTIIHHWHGDKANRRYVERWDVLTKGQYDAKSDVQYDKNGQIYLSPSAASRLEGQFIDYFKGRREDGGEP